MAQLQSRVARLVVPVSERDHTYGPADAPVTLVEYGDYQCPYCGQAYGILKTIQSRFGRRLRFAYRHFPLAEIHPLAVGAAEAAEAAAAQGRFWEMHDLLYENQPVLDESDLMRYAHQLELDVARFVNELARHTYEGRVREDFMSGVRSGVNGTPTFFINGIRHDGPWDVDTLTEALMVAAQLHA